MRAWLRAAACAAALVCVTAAASAEPTPAERETARTLLFSGREKRKAGKLHEALADFERAHGIMRVPTTGLDLGKTQEALGQLVEARATLLEVVHSPVQADEPRAFKRARQEAKDLADAIAPRLATLTVTVTTPAGARTPRVTVDGDELSPPTIGAPLKVDPGKHEIVATMAGGEEKRVSIELLEGDSRSVPLSLSAPLPVAQATPATPASGAASSSPRAGDAKPDNVETRTSPLVWIGVAAAGVGAAVGTTTGLLAFGVKSDVAARCQPDGSRYRCPTTTFNDIDHGERYATISTVAFVVGGIGALLLAYGLLNPIELHSESSSGRLVLAPSGVAGVF